MSKQMVTEREMAIDRLTAADLPYVLANTFNVHPSIFSRLSRNPGCLNRTHAFEDDILNEGAHDSFDD